ncbi:MAG: inositol monophosphatase family protein [Vulcanimicrobiaceae bacterium]
MDPLSFAIDVAREAGALLVERLDAPREIGEKSERGDLVTDADRASERLIVERIRAAFPASAVLAEEGSEVVGGGGGRWIVDPLDGTTNYAHRYPFFAVSIAYEQRGEIVCGVVYAPAIGELFAAGRGSGARCNDRPIHVSRVGRLADAMVCTGFKPARYERNGPYFAAVSRQAQAVRRDGSAALDLANVAAGRFDAFWEFDLAPWDVAAGALLVAEAGGHVESVEGGAHRLDGGSILASNGLVHGEVGATLRAVAAGSGD